MRKPGANAPGFVCSDVLPLYTARDIGDFNALRLKFIADTVGLGKVLGFLRIVARLDLRGHSGIIIAVLAEDGIRACGGLFRRIALADLISLFAQVKAQHLVKVIKNKQFRCIVGLILEHVIQSCNGERRVEVVAERSVEFFSQNRHSIFVNLSIAGLQCGDLGQ